MNKLLFVCIVTISISFDVFPQKYIAEGKVIIAETNIMIRKMVNL